MTKFVVTYQPPNENAVKKVEVLAINVLHAEKLAREQLGRSVSILSVASKG